MMNRIRILLPLFAALLVPMPAAAQAPPGTELSGNITQTLDTKNVQVGQRVTLTNVASTDGSGRVAGATLYGHVVEVDRAGQGKRPQLLITFERLVTPNHRYTIEARVLSMNQQTKSNALREVGGAVVGNIVGNILGKHLGTNAGGLLGAGGGFLYAKNYHENFSVPGGSVVTVEIVRSHRQA